MKSDTIKSIALIFHYWLKSKREFIFSFVYQLISTGLSVLIPIFTGLLVGSITLENPDLLINILFPFFTIIVID